MKGNTLVISDLRQRVLEAGFEWADFRRGVEIHLLYEGNDGGASAALLRYAPGACVPHHQHQGWEHILILHGTQIDGNGTHTSGTLVINPPGSAHDVRSPDGCVVLAIWERPNVFNSGSA